MDFQDFSYYDLKEIIQNLINEPISDEIVRTLIIIKLRQMNIEIPREKSGFSLWESLSGETKRKIIDCFWRRKK